MQNLKKNLVASVAGIAAIFLLAACNSEPQGMSRENATLLAQCLSDQGVKMYGAFWCPHCADQKKIFGKEAAGLLPYKECDPRGDNPVTDECLALKIEGYPTWVFADGSREVKVFSAQELAEKSGCKL